MRNLCRLQSNLSLVLLAIGGVLFFHQAGAATLCTGLSPSILRVYDIKAPTVEEVEVPAEELDRNGQAGSPMSRHTLMLTVSEVATWFDITHRIVPRPDGSVCDTPSLVRMGFGSARRLAFLARDVGKDACVRQKMLDHEAAHNRAFDEVVHRFIDQHKSDFQRGVVALKETPAPNPDTAMMRWETGLRIILAAAKRELLDEIQAASAHIDEPSTLAALEDACGGKIRQMEQHSG
jgi:hypothetical protein